MQRNQPVKKPVIPEIPTVRIVGHCFQQELPYLLQTIRAEQPPVPKRQSAPYVVRDMESLMQITMFIQKSEEQ